MKEKKEFNFARRWVEGLAKENEKPSILKTRVVVLGIGSLVFLGVIGSVPWLWEYKLSRDIILAKEKIDDVLDIATQVNQLKSLNAKAEGQRQLQNLIKSGTRDPGPILEKLRSILPAGSVVDSFGLQENAVTLSISVPTPVDVARLWVSLRDSGMFNGVDIQTVSLEDKAQTLKFNLTLK